MNFIRGDQFDYPTPRETIGLAQRAKHHGFQIEVDERGTHHVYEPKTGARFYVTLVSCQCKQFIGSGSAGCQHLALLQVEQGAIPEAVTIAELAVA